MKLRKNVAVSESGLLFNPLTGESFTVNPIGIEILGLMKEEKDFDEISKVMLHKYSTDKPTFEKDFHDFVGLLSINNLLEENEEK